MVKNNHYYSLSDPAAINSYLFYENVESISNEMKQAQYQTTLETSPHKS